MNRIRVAPTRTRIPKDKKNVWNEHKPRGRAPGRQGTNPGPWPDDDLPTVAQDQERVIDPSLLLELFGQTPIVFNRIYIDLTGSVQAALWLAYAIYHVSERGTDREGWFSKSQPEWLEETGLSRREQESARQRLRILGVLEERRRQNTPLHYRIVFERLYPLLETHSRRLHAERLAARSTPDK